MNNSLYKSRSDKMILGVCGGVGNYLGVDSSIVRILWAIASFAYGTGVLLYLIMAFILPYDENEIYEKEIEPNPLQEKDRNKVIAIILILSGVFLFLKNLSIYFDTRYLWPILLIVFGILIIKKGKEKNDEK